MTGLTALFAGAILVMSSRLGPLARAVPVAVALPTLALLLFQLYMDCTAGSSPRETAEVPGDKPSERNVFLLAAVMSLFALFIYLFGFAIAVPLFVFVYAKKVDGQRTLPAAGTALATGAALTIVFGVFLDVMLCRGQISVWMKWLPW